jgi:hypothetical protein
LRHLASKPQNAFTRRDDGCRRDFRVWSQQESRNKKCEKVRKNDSQP